MLAELYVLSGRDAGKLIDAVGPTIFLGRAATNHYRIRDPQASRVHCRIDITTEGLTLQDTHSGNGTYLNERLVGGAEPLSDGDEIRVGTTRLKVLIETDTDRKLAAQYLEPSEIRAVVDLGESDLRDVSEVASVPAGDLSREPETREAPKVDPQSSPDPDAVEPAEATAEKPRKRRGLREVLPGYRLEKRLKGHSHLGVAVYRATQRSLDRMVTLKVFLPRGATRKEDVERFLREAKAVGRLPHPNIVTIHDVLTRGKMRVIVTEYLAGGTIADRLDDGDPMPPLDVISVGEAIASALGFLHTQGVLHRNVKPSNVLVVPELTSYKLAGFGFATGPRAQRLGDTSFIDTPLDGMAYLAPEQLGADLARICPATDVYSLGATLYLCAAAKPPFEGDRSVALAACILRDEPLPLPDTIPESLRTILLRCLRKDSAERYPDANALLHELRACRAALGEEP